MLERFIIAAALAAISLLTAVVVLPMLYVEYLQHRRTRWIAVAPAMVR